MNPPIFTVRLACIAALVVLSAGRAAAQEGTAQPYGDLFGTSRKPLTQSLDVRASLFSGYDDNLLAQGTDGATPSDPRFQVPGVTTGFSSTATYGFVHHGQGRSATQFRLGGAASVQEFTGADTKALWVPNYGANASFATNLTPKVTFAVNASGQYAPYYLYVPLLANTAASPGVIFDTSVSGSAVAPPVVTSPGTDIGYATEPAFVESATAGASITDRITKRTSISVEGLFGETRSSSVASLQTRVASARLMHRVTRKLGLHLGFGLQDARYSQQSAASQRSLNQLYDIGLDFQEGLTFARYYTFSFSSGTSVLRQGDSGPAQFRVDGSATLARTIGRTWSASIGGNRGTSYILGFSNPFYSDSANAGVGGQLSPRVNFTAAATYLRGQAAFSTSAGNLVSEGASTRVTFGMTEHIALFAQFSYYQYQVPTDLSSTVAFSQQLHRRRATGGIALWAPIINRRSPR